MLLKRPAGPLPMSHAVRRLALRIAERLIGLSRSLDPSRAEQVRAVGMRLLGEPCQRRHAHLGNGVRARSLEWLPNTLELMVSIGDAPLSASVRDCIGRARWRPGFPEPDVAVGGAECAVSGDLIGRSAAGGGAIVGFGLLIVAPNVGSYWTERPVQETLYLLAGHAEWRFAGRAPSPVLGPGEQLIIPAHCPAQTTTRTEPLFAVFVLT